MKRAIILHDLAEERLFSIYSLVGQFNDPNSRFVRHIAILADDQTLPASLARVLHMGPPLVSDPNERRVAEEDRSLAPDLVFTLALNEEQKAKIARWTARIASEDGPLDERRYVIRPHVRVERSERGVVKYHRFSCAGYAFEAIRQLEIALVNSEALPRATEAELSRIYQELPHIMPRPKLRRHYGIEDSPPWPIMLPAYLFHGAEHFAEGAVGAYRPSHTGYASYPANADS